MFPTSLPRIERGPPGIPVCVSFYTNKLGVYVLSCYLNISRGTWTHRFSYRDQRQS